MPTEKPSISDAIAEYNTALKAKFEESLFESENIETGMQLFAKNQSKLLYALEQFDGDVLIFNMGSYMVPGLNADEVLLQQLPPYVFSDELGLKRSIFLVDMAVNMRLLEDSDPDQKLLFVEQQDFSAQPFLNTDKTSFRQVLDSDGSSRFESITHPGLSLSLFGAYLCDEKEAPLVWRSIKHSFEKILERNGKVFLGYHCGAFDLNFVPGLITVYNELKKTYGPSIQLYQQCGGSPIFYYGNNLYTPKSFDELIDRYEEEHPNTEVDEYQLFIDTYGGRDFEILDSMEDLSRLNELSGFTPTPSPSTVTYKEQLDTLRQEVTAPPTEPRNRLR